MTGQQMQKLIKLQPRLTRIAHALHRTHYDTIPPGDILQEMNLHIVENTTADPAYLHAPDKFIANKAAWRARDWCRNQHPERYASYDCLKNVVGDEPDANLSIDVATALAALDEITRRVARFLANGIRGGALCDLTGLSASQLTVQRKAIRNALAPVVDA